MKRLIGRLLWWFVRPVYVAEAKAEFDAAFAEMDRRAAELSRSQQAGGRTSGETGGVG